MRWLRKQPRSREVRRQGAPRTTRCSPHRPEDLRRTFFLSILDGAHLSQFHIRILQNGLQDARPGKNRFAYAESPAKQRHDRDLPDTAHNPNELGRIRILWCITTAPATRGPCVKNHSRGRSSWGVRPVKQPCPPAAALCPDRDARWPRMGRRKGASHKRDSVSRRETRPRKTKVTPKRPSHGQLRFWCGVG